MPEKAFPREVPIFGTKISLNYPHISDIKLSAIIQTRWQKSRNVFCAQTDRSDEFERIYFDATRKIWFLDTFPNRTPIMVIAE